MKSWAKWVNRSEASLVPGAKEFIDLALSSLSLTPNQISKIKVKILSL